MFDMYIMHIRPIHYSLIIEMILDFWWSKLDFSKTGYPCKTSPNVEKSRIIVIYGQIWYITST